MILVKHEEQPWDEWRPGVRSRQWASAATGALQLRVAEQVLDPGRQVPQHWHYFEETITILSGRAEFTVDGETAEGGPGTTLIINPLSHHGFRNIADEPLHITASMSWPINEMHYLQEGDEIMWRAGERVGDGRRRKFGLSEFAVGT